jgi:hypothetical protein
MRFMATAGSLTCVQLAAYKTMAPDVTAKSCTAVLKRLRSAATGRVSTIDTKLALNIGFAMVTNHFVYNIGKRLWMIMF